MHYPKAVSVECDGKKFSAAFVDFDVMTDSTFNSPLAHGALSIEIEGQEPIEVHYEEWLDELGDGADSRWRTGISQDWNKKMPKVSEDAVDEIHEAVEHSVRRRLRGSGWRTHL